MEAASYVPRLDGAERAWNVSDGYQERWGGLVTAVARVEVMVGPDTVRSTVPLVD